MTALLAAIGLLTRVPIRRAFSESEVAAATAYYPLVGAAIGATQAAVLWLALVWLPSPAAAGDAARMPSMVLSVCLVTQSVWITGALHMDGLADTFDGFASWRSRQEVLAIMRDPRLGTYGAVAVCLVLLLKVACLDASIARGDAVVPLMAAPIAGRWAMAAVGWGVPYARPEGGLGAVARGSVTGRGLAFATASTAILLALLASWHAVTYGAIAVGVAVVAGRASRRRIGGFTGDTLGATGELTEVAIWLAAVGMPS